MAGEIQIGGTTFATESSGTVTVANVNSATNRTNLGLGSIATQASDNISITGGTIGSSVVFPAGFPILLSTSESTSAVTSIEFNNTVITNTYKHYILRINRILPATDGTTLNLAFSTDNGSSFKDVATGAMYSQIGAGPSSGHEHLASTANGLGLGRNLGNDADIGQSAEVSIYASQDTNYDYFDVVGWLSGRHISQHYTWWTTGYVYHQKTAINFLKLSFSSGNIANHNLNLYGIK